MVLSCYSPLAGDVEEGALLLPGQPVVLPLLGEQLEDVHLVPSMA